MEACLKAQFLNRGGVYDYTLFYHFSTFTVFIQHNLEILFLQCGTFNI